MKPFWQRRFAFVAVLLGCTLPFTLLANAAVPVAAPHEESSHTKVDAPQSKAQKSAPKKVHGRTVIKDETTVVRGHLGRHTVSFRLDGRPHTTYRATLRGEGSLRPVRQHAAVRTGAHGHGRLVVRTRRGAGMVGGITAVLSSRSGSTVARTSVSRFLHTIRSGAVVQADSRIGARIKAVMVDHPSHKAQARALHALAKAPASSVTFGTTSAAAAVVADDEIEVSGHVAWTDFGDHVNPARHVNVDITDRSSPIGPQMVGQVQTDASGNYSFTFEPLDDITGERDLQVQFWAEDPDAARVYSPFSGESYSQWVGRDDVQVGEGVSINYTAPNDTEWGKAFAIHDAVWSAHLFAGIAGGGDEDKIGILWPFGADDHASTDSNIMVLGDFEWSAWDVINHEYGHWFDRHHDISDSPGGTHCVRGHITTDACGDTPAYSKEEGTRLAYGEGFANFFSLSSAHYAAVPSGLSSTTSLSEDVSVSNFDYDDVLTDHDGESTLSLSFPSDGARPDGTYTAEDNEAAVAGVLWSIESGFDRDGANSDNPAVGPEYTMSLLEDSDASRLSTLVNYVWPADGTERVRNTAGLGCVLENAEVAPYSLTTSGETTASTAPTLRWQPGNYGDHENDSFVVDAFVAGATLPYFTSDPIYDTSWTPSGRDWSRITVGRGDSVSLRVTGSQGDDPTTGPYRGCATEIDLDPSAIVNAPGCEQVTLPANDDGSTGAVRLPFAVDYFGTTYTDLFVNNNGNVTFDAPLSTFTPFTLDANTPPIIAPFFADIDTRGSGSAEVTYSYGTTTYRGHDAFCVNWLNVGYYSGHWDKLNSAQLLLVDRSDQDPGDFDIVFNYGHVMWETGDASGGFGGFGGTPAAVGYAAGNGNPDAFFQRPGSLATGELVDGGVHALSTQSNVSASTPGHYVYPVRNGGAGNSATGVVGTVTSGGLPAESAVVQVCPQGGGQCVFQTRTGPDGSYAAVGIPAGEYTVKAYPPSGLNARPQSAPATVEDHNRVTVDLELSRIDGLPAGTTISPLVGSGGEPMVNWNDTLTLRTTGCVGGFATYLVLGLESHTLGQALAEGDMTEGGPGHYSATIPPLAPAHGAANVSILIQCPGAADETIDFNIYIDPSGTIVDQDGHPVSGATVTLETAEAVDGTFTPVPDGSDLMSPANRENPMATGDTGRFGWDVVAGYYRVSAAKDGCTGPGGSAAVSSEVLTIPPPVTGLLLVLTCPRHDTTPPVITAHDTSLEGNARGGFSGVIPGSSATDEGTPSSEVTLTNDAPALLPLGTTSVTWTATDPADNSATVVQRVTVVDTTVPQLTCPADVAAYHSAAPDLGAPAVTDVVDASPTGTHPSPASWPLGTTTVTWTAADASGNRATCLQRVTLSLRVSAPVSAGATHSLALLGGGTVRAWGLGANGQLGRGTTASSNKPVVVSGLGDVKAVAAGGLFSLALKADGTVWSWGNNTVGELGDGNTTRRLTPVQVTGLPPIQAIGAGQFHALAVGLDGSVWAWGDNSFGQLGSATPTRSTRAVRVSGLTGVTSVAAGLHHSIALTADGGVWTWGGGYDGQLGNGTVVSKRPAPALVAGLAAVGSVATGPLHTVVVTRDGATHAWGNNASGQLGDGSTTRRTAPVRVAGLALAASAAGGGLSTYVLLRNGTVFAFGNNALGQLGDGTTTTRKTPVRVGTLTGVSSVTGGATHAFVGLASGQASAWGFNLLGQLGDGTNTTRKSPVAVFGLAGLMQPTP